MFGELLGLWCVQVWRDQGSPTPVRLVELGPGRGTLMADALRAASRYPEFIQGLEIALVETSGMLRTLQAQTLRRHVANIEIRWLDSLDDSVTDRPLLLLANEFFDALPIRQFVFTERGWCERMVGLCDGALAFALSPFPVPLTLPLSRGAPRIGDVCEVSPAGEAMAESIAAIIAKQGGAALIVDYGYGADSGFGETLQAVARHRFAGLLEHPGEADLSAHVDFAALASAAERGGAKACGPVMQSALLNALGIRARAEQLARANPHEAQNIAAAVERLTSEEAMGTLFRAIAIVPSNAAPPPGFIE